MNNAKTQIKNKARQELHRNLTQYRKRTNYNIIYYLLQKPNNPVHTTKSLTMRTKRKRITDLSYTLFYLPTFNLKSVIV